MLSQRKKRFLCFAAILLVLLSVFSCAPVYAGANPELNQRSDAITAALETAFEAKADALDVLAAEYIAYDTVLKDEDGNAIDMDAYISSLLTDALLFRSYEADGYELAIVEDLYEDIYIGTYTSVSALSDEIADYFADTFYLDRLTDRATVTDAVIYAYQRLVGDKYASYYNEETFAEYQADDAAEYNGIGVTVTLLESGYAEILSVTPDSPAERAGMEPGDVIVGVDGEDFALIGYSAAINRIRGESGTEVSVTVRRADTDITYTMKREKLTEYTVDYKMLASGDGKIGYIRISQFDEGTFGQFKTAYEALGKAGAEKYVFDVRNNPGGRLDSVLAVLEYILPDDTGLPLLHMQFKSGTETYYSLFEYIEDSKELGDLYKDAKDHEITAPIAVLCNEFTASAGELFTSCLMDFGVAESYGTVTYGKGTGQTGYYMTDYYAYNGESISVYKEALVNVSTFRFCTYKTPNHEGTGITPTHTVTLSEEAASVNFYKLTEENDDQLAAAVAALSAKEGKPYEEKTGFFEGDVLLWILFGILAAAVVALSVLLAVLLIRKKNERDFFTDTDIPTGGGDEH